MIDISHYFCPNPDCKHYGLRNQGNIVLPETKYALISAIKSALKMENNNA